MIWCILGATWALTAIVNIWYIKKDIQLNRKTYGNNVLLVLFIPILSVFVFVLHIIFGVGLDGGYGLIQFTKGIPDYLFKKIIHDYENEKNS